MQFSQNIDGFRQKDSQGFQTLHNSMKKNALIFRENFDLHYLPKLYIGFNLNETFY